MTRLGRGTAVAAAGATVLLTAASLAAVAAARPDAHGRPAEPGAGLGTSGRALSTCAVPTSLPGSRVTAVLADMGGMPGGPMMDRSMMGDHHEAYTGGMRIHLSTTHVAAGTVTLVAVNHGVRTHELVVLPLPAGAQVGARTLGTDGTVAETGSLGEASGSCAGGAGDGIEAGSAGWVTLTLGPGRYELLCNLPGHYAAGMRAELDVG